MNRLTTFVSVAALAATAVTSVAAAPFGIGLGIQFNKQQFQQPGVGIPFETPRVIDAIRTTCVDLAVQTSQHPNADGSVRVVIRVANTSAADYLSSPGQQGLIVNGQNGGGSTVQDFTNIPAGSSILWSDTFHRFEFPATYNAHIAFDPDIRLDGNPNNDDCHASNNSASLTTAY